MVQPKHVRTEKDATEHEMDESSALEAIQPAEILAKVETFAREQPHVAIAGAVAIGFVLGGGITPRMLGALAVLGARTYLQGTLAAQLGDKPEA